MTDEERWKLGCQIVQLAADSVHAYRNNISEFSTSHEDECSERCAVAASNVCWLLLKQLGFSNEDIGQLKNDARTPHY